MTPPVRPPEQLKSRILGAIAVLPSSNRRRHVARASLLLVGAVAVSLSFFFLAGGVRVGGRPLSLVIGTALGTGVATCVASYVALGRSNSMMGRPRVWLLAVAVASPLMLLLWKVAWSAQYDGGIDRWPERPGLRCLKLSLAIGIVPLVAVLFVRRGTDPTHPRSLGFAIGMALGLCSAELIDLWCPVAYLPHLLQGHILPAVVLGLVGSWLGGYWLPTHEPS
jgi:hypothetical protein